MSNPYNTHERWRNQANGEGKNYRNYNRKNKFLRIWEMYRNTEVTLLKQGALRWTS